LKGWETVPITDLDLFSDDGRVAINFIATEKLPIPIPAEPKPYVLSCEQTYHPEPRI
jgi:hypothetical protein